ncbi:MAG: putative metal-dependent hydrolase [Flavobacteriales bacterium]|jgi:predicted metal-dependent hydrolase
MAKTSMIKAAVKEAKAPAASAMTLAVEHQTVTYGEQNIRYQICYMPKPVHKVAIHVHPDGSVQVDAPNGAQASDIKQAVLKRARWIVKHVNAIEEQQLHVLKREYVSGETHFYLGRRYQLKVLKRKDESVKLIAGKIVIATHDKSPEYVRGLLSSWYQTRCCEVFKRRLIAVADMLTWTKGLVPKWKVTEMRKQWGSCSPKGVVSLNPHLVKAPRDCIDYVLLHELAHLKEHNHSKQFYALLDRNMPDWRSRKTKLDGLADLLINE